ncbi:MAG: four helix bundle protein [Flavobacterium sp.]|nr:four helix bundle protein [Flavobacterium sp.]
MKDYRKLNVWVKGHQLVLEVYKTVGAFPKEELFGLTSQMKRSAASIPTNIAEGCGRKSEKDFCRFLVISFGSANELEYQVILATDLKFITADEATSLLENIEEIKKMLSGLMSKLS